MSAAGNLRRAASGDAPAIAALTDAAYANYIPVIGRRPSPMDWDYARLVDEWQVWVVEVGGALAGILLLVPEADALLIESVAVAPEMQGRGLGRGLIDHALAEATRQGFQALRLYTNAKLTENIAMYRRYGFHQTRRQEMDDRTLVHMSIDVPTRPKQHRRA